jgi:PKD repeat protein
MQAVSHINGMHAAMTAGELVTNKFGEASRWDLANGWSDGDDHGMFNKGDEPGNVPLWNPRPDFYHLYYFQKYFGDRALVSQSAGKANIQSYASRFTSGQTAVVLANKGRTDEVVQIAFDDFTPGTRYYWYTLEGGDDNGDFSRKVFINGEGTEYDAGGPVNYQTIAARSATSDGGVKILAPALSVTHVIIDEGSGGNNTPPVAAISASPTSGEIALTVDFSADGSYDSDGDNIEYLWDFGDGTNATGQDVSHTYNTADNYTVTVTVFDGTNIDQASVNISATSEGATCEHPTVATLPVTQDGGGEKCLVVEGTIDNVNSWGMWAVSINGVDFTNTYSSEMPPKINGKYFIYFNAGESWAHVEINGTSDDQGSEYFDLITNVTGQGSISLSPSGGTYEENTQVILTANAAEGWVFESWSGDLSGDLNPDTLTMDSDKSVTAIFTDTTLPTYTININVVGEGSVTMNPSGGVYTQGSQVILTAEPATGYQFDNWSGDISGNNNPLELTVNSNLEITANFSEIPAIYYTLTTSTDGNGTIQLDPSGGNYLSGTVVSVEAIPNTGYFFGSWSGDLTGSENPTTITMDADKSVSAQFVESDTTDCTIVSTPITQDGVGILCLMTSDDIAYVNSWNMNLVEINGIDYTNTWSDQMPDKIDGYYIINYDGSYSWSHFEAAGTKDAQGEDYTETGNILIYPNPFNENTTVYMSNPERIESIQIIDQSGRVVEVIEKSEVNINMQIGRHLQSGFYMVNVRTSDDVQVFIITKH